MMLRFGGGGGSRVTDGGGGGGTSGQLLRQREGGVGEAGGGGVDNGKNFTVARLRSLYAELLDGVTPPADEVGGGGGGDDVGRADPWSAPSSESSASATATGRGSGGMAGLGRSLSSRGRGLGVGRGGSLNRSRQTKKRERISNAIPPSARAAAWRILSATGEGLGTGTGGGGNGMKTAGANSSSRGGRGGGGAGSATNAELRDDATAAALAVARSMEVRLVEVLRSIAEVVVYGEQNLHSLAGTEVFEYFCDKNLMALLVDIARSRPPGCVTGGGGGSIGGHPHPPPRFRGVVHTAAVKAQVLQTASILVANVQHPTSLYYLLSNDCVNDLVLSLVPLRQFTNAALEELMPVYISFLKSLALNLVSSPELLPFFLGRTKAQRRRSGTDSAARARESFSPVGTTSTTFPLFAAAVEVATSPFASNDTFVRTTALNIVLNTCQIADDSVRGVVGGDSTSSEQRTLFAHLCHRMVRTYLLIVNLTVGPVVGRRSRCDALAGEMADLQDQMQFLNDLLRCGVRPLNVRLCEWLLRRVVFPLLGNVMCSAASSSSATASASSTSSAVGVSPRKHAGGGTAVVGPNDSPPRWEAASIGPRKILSMDSSFTELHQQATPKATCHLRKTKGGGGGVGDNDGGTGSSGEGRERDEEELSTSTVEDASEDGSDSDDGGEEDEDEDGSRGRSNGLHHRSGGGDSSSSSLNKGTSRQSSISRLDAIETCTEWSESEARSQVALFVLAQMVRNIDYIPLVRMIAVAALHPLSPRRLSGECGGDGDRDDDARDGGGTSPPSSADLPSPPAAAAGRSGVVENEFTITQELNDVVQDRYVHMSATAVATDGPSVDGDAASSQPPPPSPPPSDESKGEGSFTEEGEDASQTDTGTETDTDAATSSNSDDDGKAQSKSPRPSEEAEEDVVSGLPTDDPSMSGDYGTPPESPAPPSHEKEEDGSATDSARDNDTSDEAEGSDHRPLSPHEERSLSHIDGQRLRSSGVVVVPSPYRDELLRLLSGDAGDARFIPAAIFMQNLIESEAIDEGILLSLHVLPVGVQVERGTSGGGGFEAGKNAPLPASSSASSSSCSTGGGSGRSNPGRGVDCDTATSSDLENAMSNFFSRGHAWGSNHSIVAIKVAASLALFLIPRTISTMSKSDGGIDRLRRWFRSSPLLRGLVRARANLASDATAFRRSPGVADLFVDLMESEIARRYSPTKGSNAQLGAKRLVRFPVRVVTEYSLVRRGPDDDVGAGNEVEQARFAIRLMLHMRSVCNVVRDVRGAFRRDWQEHKTVTGDTLAPLRTYDEADEDMLTIGGLKERPAVGSDLELKGRTFFSFSASWQELDKMRSKTTLGGGKKDLLIVVDPTILYIVKKRSSGNEDNSRGKILCAAPLRSIIATATDEDLWLHLAVRPTENVGMSLNNESMSFRFDSLGNLLVVREHLDRCRSLLISQMLEKTDLLLEACNKDLSVEL